MMCSKVQQNGVKIKKNHLEKKKHSAHKSSGGGGAHLRHLAYACAKIYSKRNGTRCSVGVFNKKAKKKTE